MSFSVQILRGLAIIAGFMIAFTTSSWAQADVYVIHSSTPRGDFDQLSRVDLATQQTTFVGPLERPLQAITFAPDGRLFGVVSEINDTQTSMFLLEIDRQTAETLREVEFEVERRSHVVDSMFDRQGRLWVIERIPEAGGPPLPPPDEARQLDPETGETITRADLGRLSALGYAEDAAGFYYAARSLSGVLPKRIDLETGVLGADLPAADVEFQPLFAGGDSDALGRMVFLGRGSDSNTALLVYDPRNGDVELLSESLPPRSLSPAIEPLPQRALDIPTTSEVGLILLAICLLGFGVNTLRRRESLTL